MLRRLVWAALVLSVGVEVLLPAPDTLRPWWHRLPVFHAVSGAVGCVLLVVVSKALGKFWLQRPEGGDD